jgi:hypothetical protein
MKIKFEAWESRYWNFVTDIDVDENLSDDEIIDELIGDRIYEYIESHRPAHSEYEEVSAKIVREE